MKTLFTIVSILACICGCGSPDVADQEADVADQEASVAGQEVSGTVDITYALLIPPTSSGNQIAVWIEDNDGNYVKTLYVTPQAAHGRWKEITDMVGRWVRKSDWENASPAEVEAVSSVTQAAGPQTVVWDLTDRSGAPVPIGTYIYKIDGFRSGTNMVLWRGRIYVGGNGSTSVAEAIYTHSDAAEKGLVLEKVEAVYRPSGDHQDLSQGPSYGPWPEPDAISSATVPVTDLQKITLNGVKFYVNSDYQFFTWEELPPDLIIERMPVKEFTNPDGVTHYYEAVHYPKTGSINWHQGAYLAQDAGGYLACPTSEEENTFIFNLVNDRKYFHWFPPGSHYEIGMGPWLGGYQPKGSPEPGGGWTWISGEEMIYQNWAKDLGDGVIDRDPRDNTQPNNSGRSDQRTIGYGELNEPVPTWGDYMDGTPNGGFIIEYESTPKR